MILYCWIPVMSFIYLIIPFFAGWTVLICMLLSNTKTTNGQHQLIQNCQSMFFDSTIRNSLSKFVRATGTAAVFLLSHAKFSIFKSLYICVWIWNTDRRHQLLNYGKLWGISIINHFEGSNNAYCQSSRFGFGLWVSIYVQDSEILEMFYFSWQYDLLDTNTYHIRIYTINSLAEVRILAFLSDL